MSDVTQKLTDSVLLDFLDNRWAKVEMVGGTTNDYGEDDFQWQVTPERYNPAYTGEGGTLREAIRDAIRKNSTERPYSDIGPLAQSTDIGVRPSWGCLHPDVIDGKCQSCNRNVFTGGGIE